MRTNWIDRAIGYISPAAGLRRARQRAAMDVATRGYDAAKPSRGSWGWTNANTSANAELARSGPALRARSRDLVRNNPHAASAISKLTTNLVGDGIIPRARTGSKKLDRKVNALWKKFAKRCDADGQLDFYGLQTLIARTMFESGEVLVRRRMRSKDRALPFQLQVMEPDYLDHSKVGPTQYGRYAVQGVEFDAIGQRTGYWLWNRHPGDAYAGLMGVQNGLVSSWVQADQICHVYEKRRTQARGEPWLSPVIVNIHDLADYDESERMRKKIESCMVGVVVGGDEDDYGVGIPMKEGERPGVYDSTGAQLETFSPGMFAYAKGGKDIKFNQPAATGSYEAYKRVTLHDIAAGARIPYEILTGDLSQVSFISGRLGLIEFRRMISALQWQLFVPMFCQPVWDWFIRDLHLNGVLDIEEVEAEWAPPRWPSIQPLEDAQADQLAIRTGTRTLPEVIAEHGRNPDDVFAEIADTNKKLDADGIVLDCDPRHVAKTGVQQPSPASPDDKSGTSPPKAAETKPKAKEEPNA